MYLKLVVSSLARRRSRMTVALLAVSIGATILSGLVTIYYDVPRQMKVEFRSYGANLILIPAGTRTRMAASEIEKAMGLFPRGSVVGAAPYRYETVRINERPFMAAGTVFAEARKASPFWYVAGAWPSESGSVLVGQEVARLVRLSPGKTVTIVATDAAGRKHSRDFTVSGVLQTGGVEEGFIFVSLADMGGGGDADVVECSIAAGEAELRSYADRIAGEVSAVTPRLVKRVTQSEGAVLGKLQALIYLVTAVVLLLTLICVSTTMTAVVAERRKEIGLKKALGASNGSIVLEFMGEGLFLGGFGGLLGVVLGFIFAQAVSVNVYGRGSAFTFWLAPVTVAVSVAMTFLACLLPVRSATEVEPATVLRGE